MERPDISGTESAWFGVVLSVQGVVLDQRPGRDLRIPVMPAKQNGNFKRKRRVIIE